MKKTNLLLYVLASSLLLNSCGEENPIESTSESSQSSVITSPSASSSEVNSNSSSFSDVSSIISDSTTDDFQLIKDETMIEPTQIEIGVNEQYDISQYPLSHDDYSMSFYEILVDDLTIVKPDVYDCINGLKEGTTTVKIIADEMYYDEVTIVVKSEEYMSTNIKLDRARLQNKTFAVFGDSISDVGITAYPAARPTFWCEQLVDDYNMKMYNYAKSGSTTGYTNGLMSKGDFTGILGTYMVTRDETQDALKECDYAFIYFGNNDVTYGSEIGNYDDVNDDNYLVKESFKGSYSYLIDQIRKANPNIQIICLSLSYSTWGIEKPSDPNVNYAKSRAEMCAIVEEIAEYKKAKYINLFDLWNVNTFSTHCPDGIHPQTSGYELIVDRIVEE